MSIFNFEKNAAKVAEQMSGPRSPSVRSLPGVSLVLEVSDLIRKTGENPQAIARTGDYTNVGFTFKLLEVGRLPESTPEQFEAAEALIGQEIALVYQLKGDPNRPSFVTANQRNLANILTIGFSALKNRIFQDAGEDAARSFKNPFHSGSYPTEEETKAAQAQVSQALEDAFSEGQESIFRGAVVVCDNRKGKMKEKSPGEFWYNESFRPFLG